PLDQRPGQLDLPVGEETAQLIGRGPGPVGGLLLVGAEGAQLAVRREDRLGALHPEPADELVLEVALADEEPERLQSGASRTRVESGALEGAADIRLLALVAEAGHDRVRAGGAVGGQEAAHRLRASDGEHRDALGGEVAAAALGQRADGDLVASALDQHDGARRHGRQCAKAPRFVRAECGYPRRIAWRRNAPTLRRPLTPRRSLSVTSRGWRIRVCGICLGVTMSR